MNIEYTDKKVDTIRFEEIDATEVFMTMDGHLYFRCQEWYDGHNKQLNAMNLETGHHGYFDPKEFVRRIKTKLTVEI